MNQAVLTEMLEDAIRARTSSPFRPIGRLRRSLYAKRPWNAALHPRDMLGRFAETENSFSVRNAIRRAVRELGDRATRENIEQHVSGNIGSEYASEEILGDALQTMMRQNEFATSNNSDNLSGDEYLKLTDEAGALNRADIADRARKIDANMTLQQANSLQDAGVDVSVTQDDDDDYVYVRLSHGIENEMSGVRIPKEYGASAGIEAVRWDSNRDIEVYDPENEQWVKGEDGAEPVEESSDPGEESVILDDATQEPEPEVTRATPKAKKQQGKVSWSKKGGIKLPDDVSPKVAKALGRTEFSGARNDYKDLKKELSDRASNAPRPGVDPETGRQMLPEELETASNNLMYKRDEVAESLEESRRLKEELDKVHKDVFTETAKSMGIPGGRRRGTFSEAKKWKSAIQNARTIANEDPRVQNVSDALDQSRAKHQELSRESKAALETYEDLKKDFDKANRSEPEHQPGSVIHDPVSGSAYMVNDYDPFTDSYTIQSGVHNDEVGFLPDGGDKSEIRASLAHGPDASYMNDSERREYDQLKGSIEGAVKKRNAHRERQSRTAKEELHKSSIISSFSDKSVVPATPTRMWNSGDDGKGGKLQRVNVDLGEGVSGISNARFMLRSDVVPKNLANYINSAPLGQRGERPVSGGGILSEAMSGSKELTLAGHSDDGTSYYTDGETVVRVESGTAAYLEKNGFKLGGNSNAMDARRNAKGNAGPLVITKDGEGVGAFNSMQKGETVPVEYLDEARKAHAGKLASRDDAAEPQEELGGSGEDSSPPESGLPQTSEDPLKELGQEATSPEYAEEENPFESEGSAEEAAQEEVDDSFFGTENGGLTLHPAVAGGETQQPTYPPFDPDGESRPPELPEPDPERLAAIDEELDPIEQEISDLYVQLSEGGESLSDEENMAIGDKIDSLKAKAEPLQRERTPLARAQAERDRAESKGQKKKSPKKPKNTKPEPSGDEFTDSIGQATDVANEGRDADPVGTDTATELANITDRIDEIDNSLEDESLTTEEKDSLKSERKRLSKRSEEIEDAEDAVADSEAASAEQETVYPEGGDEGDVDEDGIEYIPNEELEDSSEFDDEDVDSYDDTEDVVEGLKEGEAWFDDNKGSLEDYEDYDDFRESIADVSLGQFDQEYHNELVSEYGESGFENYVNEVKETVADALEIDPEDVSQAVAEDIAIGKWNENGGSEGRPVGDDDQSGELSEDVLGEAAQESDAATGSNVVRTGERIQPGDVSLADAKALREIFGNDIVDGEVEEPDADEVAEEPQPETSAEDAVTQSEVSPEYEDEYNEEKRKLKKFQEYANTYRSREKRWKEKGEHENAAISARLASRWEADSAKVQAEVDRIKAESKAASGETEDAVGQGETVAPEIVEEAVTGDDADSLSELAGEVSTKGEEPDPFKQPDTVGAEDGEAAEPPQAKPSFESQEPGFEQPPTFQAYPDEPFAEPSPATETLAEQPVEPEPASPPAESVAEPEATDATPEQPTEPDLSTTQEDVTTATGSGLPGSNQDDVFASDSPDGAVFDTSESMVDVLGALLGVEITETPTDDTLESADTAQSEPERISGLATEPEQTSEDEEPNDRVPTTGEVFDQMRSETGFSSYQLRKDMKENMLNGKPPEIGNGLVVQAWKKAKEDGLLGDEAGVNNFMSQIDNMNNKSNTTIAYAELKRMRDAGQNVIPDFEKVEAGAGPRDASSQPPADTAEPEPTSTPEPAPDQSPASDVAMSPEDQAAYADAERERDLALGFADKQEESAAKQTDENVRKSLLAFAETKRKKAQAHQATMDSLKAKAGENADQSQDAGDQTQQPPQPPQQTQQPKPQGKQPPQTKQKPDWNFAQDVPWEVKLKGGTTVAADAKNLKDLRKAIKDMGYSDKDLEGNQARPIPARGQSSPPPQGQQPPPQGQQGQQPPPQPKQKPQTKQKPKQKPSPKRKRPSTSSPRRSQHESWGYDNKKKKSATNRGKGLSSKVKSNIMAALEFSNVAATSMLDIVTAVNALANQKVKGSRRR